MGIPLAGNYRAPDAWVRGRRFNMGGRMMLETMVVLTLSLVIGCYLEASYRRQQRLKRFAIWDADYRSCLGDYADLYSAADSSDYFREGFAPDHAARHTIAQAMPPQTQSPWEKAR